MLDGMGEATAAVVPAVAFAFLTDPRHADLWFAGAGFETPPQGPPRAGLEWSFARTPGTRRVQPMRMSVYEPPARFVWETTFRSPLATNFVFEMRCEPAEILAEVEDTGAAEAEAATTPDDQPADQSADQPTDQPDAAAPGRAVPIQGTRLRFTIHLRPGVVQWVTVAAGYVLLRRALRERAERAARRAAEEVEISAAADKSRRGSGRGSRGSRRRRR